MGFIHRQEHPWVVRPAWKNIYASTGQKGPKSSWVQDSEPGGRLHPGAKVEKNCSPKPWVTKDNTVRQFHSVVEKLLLELGISSLHRIWIPRNGASSRNENNRSGLWSLFPLLPSYVKLPPSPSPGEGSSKRPNVACWPQVLPGIWLFFIFNYSVHLTFSHQCHKKLFQRQKDLFSFAPLTNPENQPRSKIMLWRSWQILK